MDIDGYVRYINSFKDLGLRDLEDFWKGNNDFPDIGIKEIIKDVIDIGDDFYKLFYTPKEQKKKNYYEELLTNKFFKEFPSIYTSPSVKTRTSPFA